MRRCTLNSESPLKVRVRFGSVRFVLFVFVRSFILLYEPALSNWNLCWSFSWHAFLSCLDRYGSFFSVSYEFWLIRCDRNSLLLVSHFRCILWCSVTVIWCVLSKLYNGWHTKQHINVWWWPGGRIVSGEFFFLKGKLTCLSYFSLFDTR